MKQNDEGVELGLRGVDMGSQQGRVGLGTEGVGGVHVILCKNSPKSERDLVTLV